MTMYVNKVGAVTHQASRRREVRKRIACRDGMLRGKRHETRATAGEKRVGNYKYRGRPTLRDFDEGPLEVVFAAGIYAKDQLSYRTGCLLNLFRLHFVIGVARI